MLYTSRVSFTCFGSVICRNCKMTSLKKIAQYWKKKQLTHVILSRKFSSGWQVFITCINTQFESSGVNLQEFMTLKRTAKQSGFFQNRFSIAKGSYTREAPEQSRSLFSPSLQTFSLTVCAYLNAQKYGLFCSLVSCLRWCQYQLKCRQRLLLVRPGLFIPRNLSVSRRCSTMLIKIISFS